MAHRPRWMVLILGSLAAACGSPDPGPPDCPQGHRARGAACVPVLEPCAGAAEVSTLGGGCRSVGVTACATGFASDGVGGCDPVLPAEPCPPGTRESLGSLECQPVGVSHCADGFLSDGAGGCDPVLPPGPCPDGSIEVLGEVACQPLGDCGDGTWGTIPDDGATIHVDATADASAADGTRAAPFARIADALAAAPDNGQVAVAAGTYDAPLTVSRPVRLRGRCAAMVTVAGAAPEGTPFPAVTITGGASGSAVRGVTLTGPGIGLEVIDATDVLLEEAQVRHTGAEGVIGRAATGLTVRRVSVVGATWSGVATEGGDLRIEAVVVRATRPDPLYLESFGVFIACEADGARCGHGQVIGSLIEEHADAGILINGADADVEASVIRRQRPTADMSGEAIRALCSRAGQCGALSLSGSVLSESWYQAITLQGYAAEIVDTVVRDTRSEVNRGLLGRGLTIYCDPDSLVCGRLRVESCLFSGNRDGAIFGGGTDLTITRTWVRDTVGDEAARFFGVGVGAQCAFGQCGDMVVSGSLVTGSHYAGIVLGGGRLEVTDTVVRDTGSAEDGWLSGYGIQAWADPAGASVLRVTGAVVTGSHAAGIAGIGSDAEIVASLVRDTAPDETTRTRGQGIHARCSDDTGDCGRLAVTGAVVTGSRTAGIEVRGVETAISGTTVRDTAPEEATGKGGRGIAAGCHATPQSCGGLQVTDSVVAGSHEVGIFAAGPAVEISGCLVQDTAPADPERGDGHGISVRCDPDLGDCGSVAVTATRVAGSTGAGVVVAGPASRLDGVTVADTAESAGGGHGAAIAIQCDTVVSACGEALVIGCLVDGSAGAGVAVQGVTGQIASSRILGVAAHAGTEMYGFGVQLSVLEGAAPPFLSVLQCEILDPAHTGVLGHRAVTTVAGSAVTGGLYSVVWSAYAAPAQVTADCELEAELERDPVLRPSMTPLPLPAPDAVR